MSARGLLRVTGSHVGFHCPGCQSTHWVDLKRWTFDGNYEAPTFSPSLHVTSGHHVVLTDPARSHPCAEDGDHSHCFVCHSLVEAGHIRFLNDCTHALAGQTVPLRPS